jgi:hypothetical protein
MEDRESYDHQNQEDASLFILLYQVSGGISLKVASASHLLFQPKCKEFKISILRTFKVFKWQDRISASYII